MNNTSTFTVFLSVCFFFTVDCRGLPGVYPSVPWEKIKHDFSSATGLQCSGSAQLRTVQSEPPDLFLLSFTFLIEGEVLWQLQWRPPQSVFLYILCVLLSLLCISMILLLLKEANVYLHWENKIGVGEMRLSVMCRIESTCCLEWELLANKSLTSQN